MPKVSLIAILPDNSHIEKACKLGKDGKLHFDKHWKPELVMGRSVFPQIRVGLLQKLRPPKRRAFGVYGEPKCFTSPELAGRTNKTWSKAESKDQVDKLIAMAAARDKLFTRFEFYFILIMLIILVITNVILLRGAI